MPFALRAAVPADAPAIVGLIKELANYERLAHEARPDADALANHMRRHASPRVEAIVAIDTDTSEAIGFALFFPNYSTFLTGWGIYLEDLYVQPAYRGLGVGLALLRMVAALAIERGCERLDWAVLDWNDLAISFYRKIGATPMKDWVAMRLAGDSLTAFASE
ncbi:MAG: GNAT family N-acetyltransferase [Rhodothermales bacterium]|nr:GNAT family N-acetyltransferase [Rhodothermales bacterium]